MQPRYSNDQVPSTLLCIQPAVITLIWVQQRATRHYRGKMPYVKYEPADLTSAQQMSPSQVQHTITPRLTVEMCPTAQSTFRFLPRCADTTPSNSRARRRQVDMDDSLRLRRAMSASVLSGISLLACEAVPSYAMAVEMRLFRRVVPA